MGAENSTEYLFLLQTVYDHFRAHSSWPVVRKLELQLGERVDSLGGLQRVCVALGSERIICGSSYSPTDVCRLRLPAFLQCRGAEEDVARFLDVIRYAAELYREVQGDPVTISGEEFLSRLHFSSDQARRVTLMLEDSEVYGHASLPPDGWLSFTPGPIMRVMGNVGSLADFLKRRQEYHDMERGAALAKHAESGPRRQKPHQRPRHRKPPSTLVAGQVVGPTSFRLERPRRLLEVAREQLDNGQEDAGLILVYVLLDILSALARPGNEVEARAEDFRDFVQSFVLPRSPLGCKPDDLWGARCGIIHALELESSSYRRGTARMVLHIGGQEESHDGLRWEEILERAIDIVPKILKVPRDRVVVVHLMTLWKSVQAAIARFETELSSNEERRQLVTRRLERGLVGLYVDA